MKKPNLKSRLAISLKGHKISSLFNYVQNCLLNSTIQSRIGKICVHQGLKQIGELTEAGRVPLGIAGVSHAVLRGGRRTRQRGLRGATLTVQETLVFNFYTVAGEV
jgi:hypothetical protein